MTRRRSPAPRSVGSQERETAGITLRHSPATSTEEGGDDPSSAQPMADAERLSNASTASPAGRPWRLFMGQSRHSEVDELLPVGTEVNVRTQYLGSWTTGFVVVAQLEDGYRLRRLSDGSELPGEFARTDVRSATESP